jgi:hypothetical protein
VSRRLPIVGQQSQSVVADAAMLSTVFVDANPIIAVVGARADVGADGFVSQLVAAIESTGRTVRVERAADVPPDARMLVIVGSHVPRPLRDPAASQLWERADLLLSEPSLIVAEALAAAL